MSRHAVLRLLTSLETSYLVQQSKDVKLYIRKENKKSKMPIKRSSIVTINAELFVSALVKYKGGYTDNRTQQEVKSDSGQYVTNSGDMYGSLH